MRKKIFGLVGALVLTAMAVTACGSNKEKDENNDKKKQVVNTNEFIFHQKKKSQEKTKKMKNFTAKKTKMIKMSRMMFFLFSIL